MILLLGCFGVESLAQSISIFSLDIESLGLDTAGVLELKDGRNKYYSIQGHAVLNKPNSYQPTVERPEYEIEEGQLKRNIGNNFSFYPLPFTPLAIGQLGSRLLCASKEGLWTIKDGQPKRFFIPGQKFPEQIVAISGDYGAIGMLTSDASLYVYDTTRQILKFIADGVEDFAIDKWNCLWYKTGIEIKQDLSFINSQPPVIEISRVLDGYAQLLSDPIALANENSGLTIFFTGQYPPSFDKLSYSYNIDGGEWKRPYEGMLLVGKMESGKHEILLKAEAPKGISVLSEPIELTVASAGYSLLWPLLFGGLALIGFFMWLSHQRMQKTLERLAVERDKIHMQLRLANERQKIGQLQMNPHFIFNSLNSISGLIALNENKLARTQLNKFSKMMRSVLGHSMKEYIPLGEELSFLKDYLSLEKLVRNDKFSFEIKSDIEEACMVPPMIVQPFLENAIVHGLSKKEMKGKLELELKDKGKYIEVIIEDDGIGRAAAGKYKKEGHESAALEIIEDRLKALNRWDEVGIVYEDLVDAVGAAAGTRVTLHLPKQKV